MFTTKRTIILISITLSVALIAMSPERSSSGAPASHSGAPGELTCAAAGCHDDNTLNGGSAVLSISTNAVNNKYIPGNTYVIKVKIADAGKQRFGFQLVAITNSDSTNSGTFTITDHVRTQLEQNHYKLFDRRYVSYTFNGTDPVSSGLGEWSVNWTAPSGNVGPITFYAGAVSANDDMSDKGDYVYTSSTIITAQ